MKVVGAGFGRTGTSSVKAALETLGLGNCYHMSEVFKNPEHISTWQAAADGQPIGWRTLFANYGAAVDWPACSFYRELMSVYPEAKVLLTVRDPEKWYQSVMNTIYFTNTDESDDPERRAHLHMIKTLIWNGTFGGRFEDKPYAISVFNRHVQQVKEDVPPERLLVYEVSQGWEPLCRFLDVPVPVDTSFPRLNDTASFQKSREEHASQRLEQS